MFFPGEVKQLVNEPGVMLDDVVGRRTLIVELAQFFTCAAQGVSKQSDMIIAGGQLISELPWAYKSVAGEIHYRSDIRTRGHGQYLVPVVGDEDGVFPLC